MYTTDIHRDLTSYRPKVVGLLTARSLACTAAALAAGVAAYGYLTWVLGLPFEEVSVVVYATTIPFWALGYWEPDGMHPEAWLPLFVRHRSTLARIAYEPARRYAPGLNEAPAHAHAAGATSYGQRRAWRRWRHRRGIERWDMGSERRGNACETTRQGT